MCTKYVQLHGQHVTTLEGALPAVLLMAHGLGMGMGMACGEYVALGQFKNCAGAPCEALGKGTSSCT